MPEIDGISQDSYGSWMVEGMGGISRMLDRYSRADVRVTAAQLDQLEKWADSIVQSLDRLRKRGTNG